MIHKHHIIPKHDGGTDDESNLISLTVEEHAEAHKKLYKEHGRWQDKLAWQGLSKMIDREEIISTILSQPRTEEWKQKISEAHKGMKKPWARGGVGNLGKPKTEEHRRKLSEAHKGMKKPWAAMAGFGNKGKPKSKEHIEAVSIALSRPEVKEKWSKTWANKPLVVCPHCGVEGSHNMTRYHFDNCKDK